MSDVGVASQTIYLQNISEKLSKNELKSTLYYMFSSCGEIVEVHIRHGEKYRGQAWITFNDVRAATKAVKEFNKRILVNKPLRVFFSKNKADIVAKADGTYKEREKDEGTGKKRKFEEDDGSVQQDRKLLKKEGGEFNVKTEATDHILIQNLPLNVTEMMLKKLLENYSGVRNIQLKEGGQAIVEFDSIDNAAETMSVLQGYSIASSSLLLQYID